MLKKKRFGIEDTVDTPEEDCQYVEFFSFHNPNAEPQAMAANGNLCGVGSFNYDRTLNPGASQTQMVNACVDMNSISYTPAYVTIAIDPEHACA